MKQAVPYSVQRCFIRTRHADLWFGDVRFLLTLETISVHYFTCDINPVNTHLSDACLFQVAAEIAAPLTNAKKLTMVSVGQNEVGVSKLTTEVLQMVERLPKMVEGVTGVDISKVCHCSVCSLLYTANRLHDSRTRSSNFSKHARARVMCVRTERRTDRPMTI